MSQGHYTMELLAEMIRRVSGKTLPEFAKERIFG
jgi:CubicO group peptidase (beta-lactamase class C family)